MTAPHTPAAADAPAPIAAPIAAIPQEKLAALEELLRALAPVAVGFSGGVDSAFLAAVCARAIPDRAVLIHLDSPFVSTPERTSCAALADRLGLPVLRVPFDACARADVAENSPQRCYLCKRAGFERILEVARERGSAHVLDGSNADDAAATDRPGTRALRELGVRSPLMETGWTKAEERAALRAWGFEVWSLPAGACLATRIATGEPITPAKLALIRACEDALAAHGCQQVRARLAGDVFTIEGTDEDLALIAHVPDKRRGPDGTGVTDDPGAGDVRHASAPLLPEIAAELTALIAQADSDLVRRVRLEPQARPYRRGAMNAGA